MTTDLAPAAHSGPDSGGRRSAWNGGIAVWVLPALFWLYYLTPLLVAPPSLPLVLLLTVPEAIGIALLFLRRRQPVLVATLTGLLLAVSPGVLGAAMVAQASLARRSGRAAVVLLSAGWMVAAKLLSLLLGPYADGWTSASSFELSLAIAGVVIATLIGWLSDSRAAESRSRVDLERARQEAEDARIDQARMAERERIAREMHDVLAHRLSLVAMHAGALTFRTDLSDDQTRQTAQLIQQNARQSLDELRVVLSDLRGADTAPEPPQPSLSELTVLVADTREAQPVDLDLGVDPGAVPDQVSRQAYRIVQEALTNARKHAPGTRIRATLSGTPGNELLITVDNPRADLAIDTGSSSGLGLIGVAERAASLGGSCHYGFDGDRFTLSVSLPWLEKA